MKESNITKIKKLAILAATQIAPSHGECEPLNEIIRLADLKGKCDRAESLGMQAAMTGIRRVPLLDEYVMTLIEGMPVGTGAEDIFKAWMKGWDSAQDVTP